MSGYLRWFFFSSLILWGGSVGARTLVDIRASSELRICVAGSSAAFYQTNAESFARFLGVKAVVTKLDNWDKQFQNADGKVDKEGTYEAAPLADGRCDVFPNDLHIVAWRKSKMLLVPYYATRKVILAHRDLRPVLTQVSDLAGHTAAVQKDTAYDSWLKEQNEKRFSAKPVVMQYAPTAESMARVAAKTADFTLVGSESAFKWARSDLGNLDILFPVDEPVQVGWGISPRASDLRDALERFFVESTRVASDLDRSWTSTYGISLMEYRVFDASFERDGLEWKAIFAWTLPIGTGLLGVLMAMGFWTRRMRQVIAEHQRTESDLLNSQKQIAIESQRRLVVSRISNALQQAGDDPAGFARIVLDELVHELGGGIGAFFLRAAGEDVFRCLAGHGIAAERCAPIRAGEGWAGAVVLTKEMSVCRDIPPGYLGIESGTLGIDPVEIAVIPIRTSGEVLALVEIGFLEPFHDQAGLLSEALPVIGLSLEIMLGKLATLDAMKAASDEQLAIFESLTLGISFLKDRKIVRANAKLGELFGRTMDEMVGQSTRIWYRNDEDFLGVGASPYDDLNRHKTHHREQQLMRKDGSLFWCHFSVCAVDKEDLSCGVVCALEDITERRAAAEALKHANEEQVAIFESLTHGIGFIKDRIILRANSKHAELFGREMDEIEGQSTRVWYPDDAAYALGGASVYEDLRQGVTHVREQQLQRKDGSLFWCHISARAVDSQDLSRGLVCVLEDISDRRQAENELSERMQELERFTRLTIDREEKMIQLKEEVNDLLEQAAKEKKYKIVEE